MSENERKIELCWATWSVVRDIRHSGNSVFVVTQPRLSETTETMLKVAEADSVLMNCPCSLLTDELASRFRPLCLADFADSEQHCSSRCAQSRLQSTCWSLGEFARAIAMRSQRCACSALANSDAHCRSCCLHLPAVDESRIAL